MAKRERKNELKIFLSNDEQYILEQIANPINTMGNVYKANVEEVKKLMNKIGDTQKPCCQNSPT